MKESELISHRYPAAVYRTEAAVTTMPYVAMDITDKEAVDRKTLTEINPDVVVHCAAWTAVDLAEDEDKKA